MTVNVDASATKPEPVTPAAPFEDSSMLASMVTVWVRLRSMLQAWAMNTAASER